MVTEPATVDDLQSGDHACLTFSDPEERLDIVAEFIRDGLAQGDRVLCLTDVLPPRELSGELTLRGLPVRQSVASGQLEVTTSAEAFITSGTFRAAQVIDRLHVRIGEACRAGHPRLRITADMSWALRPVTGLEDLIAYEARFTRLLADGRATAVCQYDRQGFDPVTLAGVAASHGRAVAALTYHNDAVLRICRQHLPPGVRIAGEMDFRAVEPLNRALGESVRLDEHVVVNMSQLRFVDVAAAGVVLQAALGLADSQRMTAICRQPVGKVLRALGADLVPSLRLVVRDGG